jgi:addiction module HigA family antidote
MAINNTIKLEIPPTHPGEMLRKDFLPDYELNATSLATALGVSRQTVNELFRAKRSVSPLMAFRKPWALLSREVAVLSGR